MPYKIALFRHGRAVSPEGRAAERGAPEETDAMPKHKTKKSIAKRFRKTARGKVLRASAGKSHLLGHKSRKRKRHLRGTTRVSAEFEKKIAIMLG